MKSNYWRLEEDLILKLNYYDCSIIGCKNKLLELGYNRTVYHLRYNIVDANHIINKAKEINTPYKLERKWGA